MIEEYAERRPDGTLGRYVQRMGHVHVNGPLPPEQLAPDSFIKLSLILDGHPQYFNGRGEPMDWHHGFSGHVPPRQGIIATAEGPVRLLFVNFYPSGFQRIFGMPVEQLTGRMLAPEHLLGDRADQLYAMLRSSSDPEHKLDIVSDFILRMIMDNDTGPPSMIEELEQFIRQQRGIMAVSKLAERAGCSDRQVQRRFKAEVGLSPKAFSQMIRFNQAYGHMKRTGRLDLDVALSCGYFDESHMLKDLSYFLGKAPKRFSTMVRPMVDLHLGR